MYSSSLFTSARAILGVLPAATLIKMSLAVAGKLPYVVVVSVQATRHYHWSEDLVGATLP